jgi:hypothetical protein
LTAARGCGTLAGMSAIEVAPLGDRLEEDDLKAVKKQLEHLNVKYSLDDDQAPHMIARRVDEDVLTEFLDRLEAHDMAADIYLPLEFDGRFSVGDYRFASARPLEDVLEELKDELDVEADDKDDEEEDDDYEEDDEDEADDEDDDDRMAMETQLRAVWELVSDGCAEALERGVPLHLRL